MEQTVWESVGDITLVIPF